MVLELQNLNSIMVEYPIAYDTNKATSLLFSAILPVQQSQVIPAVWCLITLKCGLMLLYYVLYYKRDNFPEGSGILRGVDNDDDHGQEAWTILNHIRLLYKLITQIIFLYSSILCKYKNKLANYENCLKLLTYIINNAMCV